MRIKKTSQYMEGGINIETGSNNNGYYIKYSNGDLICYNSTSITNSWNTLTYPVEFISPPIITTGLNSGTAETSTMALIKTSNIGNTTFRICRVLSSGYDNGNIDYIAIGKWK